MIPILYQIKEVDIDAIYISGTDAFMDVGSSVLTTSPTGYKIDLLAYNRMSSNGDVLTSVVSVSMPKEIDTQKSSRYVPAKLYKNNEFEKALVWGDDEDYTYFNKVNTEVYFSLNKEQSRFTKNNNETFEAAQVPAPVISEKYTVMDGFYSTASVGLWDADEDGTGLAEGSLGIPLSVVGGTITSDHIKVWTGTEWANATTVSNQYSLAFYFRDYTMPETNEMVLHNFLWFPENDKLFKSLLVMNLDDATHGTDLEGIHTKTTLIEMYGRNADFYKAQLVNQMIDYYKIINT